LCNSKSPSSAHYKAKVSGLHAPLNFLPSSTLSVFTAFYFEKNFIYYRHRKNNPEGGNMPIYEYECRKCKERFEVLQKIDEDNSGLCCPKCNTEKPERILSAFCSGTGRGAANASAHSSPGHS
jgi:putative FmdB family regulatory protein